MARAEAFRRGLRRVLLASLAAFLVSACQEKPVIEGTVTDNFGRPIDDVVVAIADSPTSTSTDAAGVYRLPHALGKTRILFTKDGYAAGETTLDVKPGKAQVSPVQLYKLLKSQGWWLVGTDDYRSLNSCTLIIRQDRDANNAVTDVYLYQQDPTPLRGTGTKLVLLDNTTPVNGEEMKLLAVSNIAEVMNVGPRGKRSTEVPITPIAGAPFGRWFSAEVTLGTAYVYLPVNTEGVPLARGGGRCFSIQPR